MAGYSVIKAKSREVRKASGLSRKPMIAMPGRVLSAGAILLAALLYCGKTTTPVTGMSLAAPLLYSPAANATGQDTAVALVWKGVTNAGIYRVCVSTSDSFSNAVFIDSLVLGDSALVTQIPAGLLPQSRYYWRVRCENSRATSAWSVSWSFVTRALPPALGAPGNDTVNLPPTVTLSWDSAGFFPKTYRLQVSTNSSFSVLSANDSAMTQTSATLGPLSNGVTYYWRVSVTSQAGVSAWSNNWSFTIVPLPPDIPVPASPSNGLAGISTAPAFSWSSAARSAGYILEIAPDSLFGNLRANDSGIQATRQTVGVLTISTTYYWRVQAENGGGESAWSGVWSFTTAGVVSVAGMVQLPGGTYQMGSANEDADEAPVHTVTITSFYMDANEVTQAEYQSLMGENPSFFQDSTGRMPVENLTWWDAVLFCNARSKRDGLDSVYSYTAAFRYTLWCDSLSNFQADFTQNGYRLPTEAEWEYACRAGSVTDYYWGDTCPPTTTVDTLAMDSNAVWSYDSPKGPEDVGTKLPNAFGLHDMSGNVCEWCNDWYQSTYYASSPVVDPPGPLTGTTRVLRGGSWAPGGGGRDLVSSYRTSGYPIIKNTTIGFRCSLRW
jgi:formylglycine-generating enzyme required for sulfatase activity